MEAILATGITGLFAYWVWLLKHEVGRLQQQIFTPSSVADAAHGTHATFVAADQHATIVGQAIAPGESPKEKIARKSPGTEGGIPTWTLG